jgi:hypothetical protein
VTSERTAPLISTLSNCARTAGVNNTTNADNKTLARGKFMDALKIASFQLLEFIKTAKIIHKTAKPSGWASIMKLSLSNSRQRHIHRLA